MPRVREIDLNALDVYADMAGIAVETFPPAQTGTIISVQCRSCGAQLGNDVVE